MEYKSRTNTFGKDAEHYLAGLYSMNMNPPGSRKPDLNNDYLFLEVKSGRQGKGSMVDDQLHYSAAPTRNDMFPQAFPKIKTYYTIVERTDRLKTKQISVPYSNIRITWGDQHMIPGELAFSIFAVENAYRIHEERNLSEILKDLHDKMQKDSSGMPVEYKKRRSGKNWQNLDSRMINTILGDYTDSSVLKEKLAALKSIYPIDSLKEILIQGPNDTKIRIASQAEDLEYFGNEFQETLYKNIRSIEEISRMRIGSEPLLDKIIPLNDDLFGFGINGHYQFNMNKDELDLLKRLSVWKK